MHHTLLLEMPLEVFDLTTTLLLNFLWALAKQKHEHVFDDPAQGTGRYKLSVWRGEGGFYIPLSERSEYKVDPALSVSGNNEHPKS